MAVCRELKMKNRGFTLVEVLVAIILVGLAIASLVSASISHTAINGSGADLSTAEFLLQQAKELTVLTEYDNLLSNFDDASYSPPKGADGQSLTSFSAFTQNITVQNVSNTDFGQVVADGISNFVRITVTIVLNSKTITSASWIRADIDD